MCTPPPLPYCIICASLTIQSGFDCAAQCVWDYFFPSSRSLSSKDKRQRRARIIRQGFWHLVRLRRQCTRYDNWHIFCAVKKPNTCDRFPKFTFRRDVARRFPPNSKRKTGLFETWAQCVEDSWVGGGGCSVLKLLTASHDGTVAIAHHSGGGPRVGSHGVSRTTRSHRTDWDHHHHHHHEGGSLFFLFNIFFPPLDSKRCFALLPPRLGLSSLKEVSLNERDENTHAKRGFIFPRRRPTV